MAVTQPTFADINDWTHQQKARSHMSVPEAARLWDHTGLMHHKQTPEQIFNSYKTAVMWEEFVIESGFLNVTFCILTLLEFIVVNKWVLWTIAGKNCWFRCCQTVSVLWWTDNLCWCSRWNKNCVSVSLCQHFTCIRNCIVLLRNLTWNWFSVWKRLQNREVRTLTLSVIKIDTAWNFQQVYLRWHSSNEQDGYVQSTDVFRFSACVLRIGLL